MNFILNVKVLTDMNDNYLTSRINFEGDPVDFVINKIETAIEGFENDKKQGKVNPAVTFPEFYNGNFLKKRYSTNPRLTDINYIDLYSECYEDSGMLLQIAAVYSGLDLEIVKSNFITPYKTNAFHHFYLRTFVNRIEVIVEVTLGQFLTNYQGIFVGTRDELRKLFVLNLKNDPSVFAAQWMWARELMGDTPENMFKVIWGSIAVEA